MKIIQALTLAMLFALPVFAFNQNAYGIEADTNIVYEYDFENGFSGWTTVNLADATAPSDWHLSTAEYVSQFTSAAGNDSATGLYYPGFYQALVSPPISLPANADELQIEFEYFGAFYFTNYQDGDFWYAEISSDGGTTWNMITNQKYSSGNLGWLTYPDAFSGAETGLITEYAGETVQIRFVVEANDDEYVLSGLYIDDFKIIERLCDTDPLEPNNTPGDAVAIAYGDSIAGSYICPAADEDWYVFTAQEDDFVELGVSSSNVVQLTFYDSSFNVISYNFWSNVLRYYAEYTGSYYVQISKSFSSGFQSDYAITLKKLGGDPDVLSVTDIEGDEGLQVRVVWKPSFYDAATGNNPMDYYALYREVPESGDRPIVAFRSFDEVDLSVLESFNNPLLEVGESIWDFVATIPAVSERPFMNYSYVAPTLWDDSLSTFIVAAVPKSGYQLQTVWGLEGSGISVDNTAPDFLTFAIQPGTNSMELTWAVDPQRHPDVEQFRIYRHTDNDFQPEISTLLNVVDKDGISYTDEFGSSNRYYYIIEVLDSSGNAAHTPVLAGTVTSAEDNALPVDFALEQNYPNPFNPVTNITYQLPQAAQVTLKVYNITGSEVVTLVDEYTDAGYHTITFNAADLGSGVYFYRIQAGDFAQVKKMMLLK
jgi:hypothetical protein